MFYQSSTLKQGLEIFDMNLDTTGATVDGGDVLYTGSELFVGKI